MAGSMEGARRPPVQRMNSISLNVDGLIEELLSVRGEPDFPLESHVLGRFCSRRGIDARLSTEKVASFFSQNERQVER